MSNDVNVNGQGAHVYPVPAPATATPEVVRGVDGQQAFVIVREGYTVEYLNDKLEGRAEHHFDDVSSFAAYLNREFAGVTGATDPSDVDILVQSDKVIAVVRPGDERPQMLRCDFEQHPAFTAWKQVFGNELDQRKIQQHVRAWRSTMSDAEQLMAVFSAIQVTGKTEMTSHMDETGALRLSSAEGKADVSVKIPSSINVSVPVFDGVLDESGALMEYRLDVLVSTSLDPLRFVLACPTLPLVYRQARRDVASQLARLLHEDFLVGLGSANHTTRSVPAAG